MDPGSGQRAARPAALVFIFITVMIDILSFGIIIPVLPHLVQQLSGDDIGRAALWVGAMQTLFALIQFVAAPVQGTASDRYGRRKVILLSNLGLGVDFAVMASAPSLWLLFVGRAVSGATSASFSAANAYIADITPKEKRAAAFGMIGAAFGVGFVIGPALGGFLGHLWIRLPFWTAAGLSLVNFCYGCFVLPESLPPERRSARFRLRDAHPFGALMLLRRYPRVAGLAAVIFLYQLGHYVLQSTFVLYADYRYAWGPRAVGYTLALVGLCSGLVQGVLVGRLVPRLGERRTLLFGLAAGIVGLMLMGLAPTAGIFLVSVPVIALWGLTTPPAQALMTAQVDPREQGRLQGAITSLMSATGIFGPTLFTGVFAAFIGPAAGWRLPGAAFLLAALLGVAGLALAWRTTRRTSITAADAA